MNRQEFLKSKFTVEHLSCFHVRPQSGPAVNILVDVFWRTKAHILHWMHTLVFSHVVTSGSLRPHGMQRARLPFLHYPSEFVQTHVLWFGDAIQPSHPLLSPSPPAFNLPQHQGLFQWVSSSHQVAKVLEFQLQYQSFQWIFRVDFLGVEMWGHPMCICLA